MLQGNCLTDVLLNYGERNSHEIAVNHNNETLTYASLIKKSREIAFYLRFIGVAEDQCVGLYMDPSTEMIISVWGILFSNSAYLPLAIEYPASRLQYMVQDSDINYIVTRNEHKADLKQILPEKTIIVTLEDVDEFSLNNFVPNNFVSQPSPTSLAYVIYTSGSTGKPKGVMITHEAILNQMQWLKEAYKIDESKTILHKTPLSFDAAQWEILSVAYGAKIVIGGEGIHRDPERIIKKILRYKITTLQCVPTLLNALLYFDNFEACKSLTQVFSGGEALSKKSAKQFFGKLPECELINLYGPTECTINASSYRVNLKTLDSLFNMVPIGYPVANTVFYILDDEMVPVTGNTSGELYIGGIQLSKGYINKSEITSEKFIPNPFLNDEAAKLYKTGDMAFWNNDGSVQYSGRVDNQVKLRGYRIELDEIQVAIENHSWVKNALITVRENPSSKIKNLVAFVALDSKEAVLMDQGNHGIHHQSKENKFQAKTQLSNLGCRVIKEEQKKIINLSFKEPTEEQQRLAFSRKTYRFYKGDNITKQQLLELLKRPGKETKFRSLENLDLLELSSFLRYFGQFESKERLLPKYSYASPGALYGVQIYVEINKICGLQSGIYYYHPVNHQLVLIQQFSTENKAQLKIHFIGKKQAIEPVYKNNIQEVLEMEVGHILGVFEKILPKFGLYIDEGIYDSSIKSLIDGIEDDYYLGTFSVIPNLINSHQENVNIYVQIHHHTIPNLTKGLYQYVNNSLKYLTEDIILKKDVIAINQGVYDRSIFGISIVSTAIEEWKKFIVLGKKLQHLQMNPFLFGLMSSGYSSKSNNNLPSAKRLNKILGDLGHDLDESYFCVGGKISKDQLKSQNMNEDIVHMKGPAEMLKEDLVNTLPHYMVPNNIIILNELPLTPNGKLDKKAIHIIGDEYLKNNTREIILPRSRTENLITEIWIKIMQVKDLSIQDDFFEFGGNSLSAVSLLNKINEVFDIKLPMQILFEFPTIEKLARKIDENDKIKISRLIPLQKKGLKSPIFCWPGLGGYTMNLKLIGKIMGEQKPFYGVQSQGINSGELPYKTIIEMANKDVEEILRMHPSGPFTLFGFSFGARVAFESCYQLEKLGKKVENLILIAPGSPKIWSENETIDSHNPSFRNPIFKTILFSVFAGKIDDPRLNYCLNHLKDQDSFTTFICEEFESLTKELVTRIIEIVKLTYEFKYNFKELKEREIKAPVTIFKAQGDDYSFLENSDGFSQKVHNIINLRGDHYNILKSPYVEELVGVISEIIKDGDDKDIDKQIGFSKLSGLEV